MSLFLSLSLYLFQVRRKVHTQQQHNLHESRSHCASEPRLNETETPPQRRRASQKRPTHTQSKWWKYGIDMHIALADAKRSSYSRVLYTLCVNRSNGTYHPFFFCQHTKPEQVIKNSSTHIPPTPNFNSFNFFFRTFRTRHVTTRHFQKKVL